jgi:hypothetical protein
VSKDTVALTVRVASRYAGHLNVRPLRIEVEADAEAVPAKAGFLCSGGIT